MRRSFSRAFAPPAPVVPLRLRAPGGRDAVEVDAKVDTGADLCAVPASLVVALDLPPVRTVRATGFSGAAHDAIVYRIDLEIDDLAFRRIETLAFGRPYALVGRNVLRHLVARFDGPRERLDLSRRVPR